MSRHAPLEPRISNLTQRIDDAMQRVQLAMDETTATLGDVYASHHRPMSVVEAALVRWLRAKRALARSVDELQDLLDERISG